MLWGLGVEPGGSLASRFLKDEMGGGRQVPWQFTVRKPQALKGAQLVRRDSGDEFLASWPQVTGRAFTAITHGVPATFHIGTTLSTYTHYLI